MPLIPKMLAAAAFAAALLTAGTAQAQDPATDPPADSPSGVIYEIPLDQGRGDAAPRTDGGAPGGGSGGSGGSGSGTGAGGGSDAPVSSSIRSSDNGFSSSPTVPGAETSGSTGGKRESRKGADRSTIDRTRARERDIPASAPQARVVASGAGSPSITRALLLIGIGAALACALGLAARQAARRSG